VDRRIKIALPKGKLLPETAALIQEAGWGLNGYREGARLYNLESSRSTQINAKIFHEKDIPIQVAMGNYDIGICGLDWIEELVAKYPGSNLVKVRDLGYGKLSLFAASSRNGPFKNAKEVKETEQVVCIASEYPNLAEALALSLRLKRFNVFPVWGAAEIYPPESAGVVLLAGNEKGLFGCNLIPLNKVLESRAFLIANRISWESKDLSQLLEPLVEKLRPAQPRDISFEISCKDYDYVKFPREADNAVRLALPDGHQQKHTVSLLNKAGIAIKDYPSDAGNRRPEIAISGVTVKVIRPQDMPLQVANGNFDLAISGKDWLREHLYKFPSSPVVDLLDLGYGRVRIVAAVHSSLPVTDMASLRRYVASQSLSLRIASEYVNIADKYARDSRLGMYRVIPTWGATEAFLPDDADLLIENTETGKTLAQHDLRIIDTLFESTGYLIGNTNSINSARKAKINSIVEILKRALEEK
jgi:ATP phosphoribosyltransferase